MQRSTRDDTRVRQIDAMSPESCKQALAFLANLANDEVWQGAMRYVHSVNLRRPQGHRTPSFGYL